MPTPGKRWRHVTISTYNAWPPGDPRGWRSRKHKKHSSGDHRNPPPRGEHAGIHRYSRSISGVPVILPRALRCAVLEKLREYLKTMKHRVLAISVSGMHIHALIELPSDYDQARHEVGRCKQALSLLIGDQVKGKVWQKSCGAKLIRDVAHHRNVFKYIRDHVHEGAWVWTYRDGVLGPSA